MSIAVEGNEALALQLALLPDKIVKAVEKNAVAEVNRRAAALLKQEAPRDSGGLINSIKPVIRKYKGGRIVVGIIGPDKDYTGVVMKTKTGKKNFRKSKKGADYTKRPAKYAHLVESGTQQRTTQSGANRGSVSGTHFTEKVIRQIEPQIEGIFADAVSSAVRSM